MKKTQEQEHFEKLPQSVQEFIKLVIKKMGYRRKVRIEVARELTTHFEDELRQCANDQQKMQKAQWLTEQFGDVKLLGILLRRAKKRCRPLWRTIAARTFQTVGVLILSFALYVVWFLSGKPAITTDYLAELNRMVRPAADDSQNAGPLFDQAVAACPNMADYKTEFWGQPYADMNDTEKTVIAGIVSQYARSLQLIAQGVDRPHCWREYKAPQTAGDCAGCMLDLRLPHLTGFKNLARALCYRAQIHAAEGQYSEAFTDLITCYKFARLIGQGEKTLVEQLVGTAISAMATMNILELLAEYDIDSKQLALVQDAFLKAQAGQEFRMRLSTEKLMIYDAIQRSFTEDRLGGGHLYPKRMLALCQTNGEDTGATEIVLGALLAPKNWGDAARFMFYNPNKAQTKQQADEFYALVEKTSKLSPAQLREKNIDLGKQAESIVEGNIFLRCMIPALSRVPQISYRLKTGVQSTAAIIAVLRFKADTGQYPEDLTELQQAGYIKEIPIDPFSDKPLSYKKTDEGFTLYSVGPDFKDNRGVLGTNTEGVKRLWADEGDAVFWPVQE